MTDDPPEPSREELAILTQLGRLQRMLEQGVTPTEAARRLCAEETVEEYIKRNQDAMEALRERMLSPEYLTRWAAIMAEPDPQKKAAAQAQLKRDNFSAIDMEAVHRDVAARNRQLRAEGVLPPEMPV